MKEKITCAFCDAILNENEIHSFDGRDMCADCFDEQTTTCDNCSTRIWTSDIYGDAETTLCKHCYDYEYRNCEECGALIHNDDVYYEDDSDYPYCQECYEKLQSKAIKSYGYKPEPIFYGSGNLFMGVELEIDKGGECYENAQDLLDIANSPDERIYCKHDGSITDGFEIVTHPMTLEYHANEMPWLKLMEKAINLGYRSHNTQTCGLHIHINRLALGVDYEKREEVIGRIVHFVELHWNELLKFSRRTEENINKWASRYGISTTAKDTYKKAKDKHLGRYVAVNLENYNTIEFRLFRGTLRYKTFIATLQLVDEICNVAIKLTDKQLEGMSWSAFVSGIDKPELIEYLKSKQLYVNELLQESEEI